MPDREEGEKIVQMRTEKRHRKIFDIFDIKKHTATRIIWIAVCLREKYWLVQEAK